MLRNCGDVEDFVIIHQHQSKRYLRLLLDFKTQDRVIRVSLLWNHNDKIKEMRTSLVMIQLAFEILKSKTQNGSSHSN